MEEHLGALRAAAARAMEEIAARAEDYARQLAPVRTGRLRDSVTGAASQNEAAVGSGVPYAARVELEKPFLRPALTAHAEEYRAIIVEALKGGGA